MVSSSTLVGVPVGLLLLLWSPSPSLCRDHQHPHPTVLHNTRVYQPTRIEDRTFWYAEAEEELQASLAREENKNVAKNVIVFLGDGMSIPTITASRIYKGQQNNQSGEEYKLVWEDFPDLGLIKTYNVDKQVPDSAATATAYLCGSKTNYYTVGVDATVIRNDCTTVTEESKLTSVAQWALEAGKRAGFVTSTRVYHATPSATYAHSATRSWECDEDIDQDTMEACPDFKDIARQLVEDFPGRDFSVVMGGGYQGLTSNTTSLPGDPLSSGCMRTDGKDLFQLWQTNQEAEGRSFAAVRTRSELQALDLNSVDYLMGIYSNSHVPYEYLKRELVLDIPTLAEMTEAAITVLNKEENGFFLLVEGGRIDLAHHGNKANTAMDETAAFDDAIRVAIDMLGTEETLMIVTADHSHVATMNGYPMRGQDIRGFSSLMDDDLPITTLSYANGPGYDYAYEVSTDGSGVVRRNLTDDDVTAYDYEKTAGAPRGSETHGGDDVAIYAIGPMSHLFQRTHEQSYIAHVIGYASCTGPNLSHCQG